MTEQEAIDYFNNIVIDTSIGLENMTKTTEIINISIKALEKQIPQAIKKVYVGEDGRVVAFCPKCHYVVHREEKYCHKCGQAIKWE